MIMTKADFTQLPNELTPLNLNAYLMHAFATCGCVEIEDVIKETVELLEWHEDSENRTAYENLYEGRVGVFYLLAGRLDALGLAEHGTAIRHPWLTPDGKRLLAALKDCPVNEIENAKGEAYDGLWYGDS